MAVFLRNDKHKSTFTLSRYERYLFLLLTAILTFSVIWTINDNRTQRQAIIQLKQHQYLFNQSCQQALTQGADRNITYCSHAQHYDHALMLALKNSHIEVNEAIELESYFKKYYQPVVI